MVRAAVRREHGRRRRDDDHFAELGDPAVGGPVDRGKEGVQRREIGLIREAARVDIARGVDADAVCARAAPVAIGARISAAMVGGEVDCVSGCGKTGDERTVQAGVDVLHGAGERKIGRACDADGHRAAGGVDGHVVPGVIAIAAEVG